MTNAVPIASIPSESQRRHRLRWPVWLSHGERNTHIETRTKTISSSEFCCPCPESLMPGEMLNCQIRIPSWAPGDPGSTLTLSCRARVVWVEWDADTNQFDVTFGIEQYSVQTTGLNHSGSTL